MPGREAEGILQAMKYLPPANRVQEGDIDSPDVTAEGKNVIIIGGGDTGADCLGTALRQGALSIQQFEIMPKPPSDRSTSTPWPTWPLTYRVSSAHEEGGERQFAINTEEFITEDGRVVGVKTYEVEQVSTDSSVTFEKIEGTEKIFPADLVLLALGFTGPETSTLLDDLDLELDERGNIKRDENFATKQPGVFVCGDMGRGQSLIVWAIAEGRSVAHSVDKFLQGESRLPFPVAPTDRPLS
ncbi:MAG: hypothetical protein CL512_01455 [Actinobacteria bacterium]|nr:hypothetical protein [Actinomycetota bacterium]